MGYSYPKLIIKILKESACFTLMKISRSNSFAFCRRRKGMAFALGIILGLDKLSRNAFWTVFSRPAGAKFSVFNFYELSRKRTHYAEGIELECGIEYVKLSEIRC